MQKATQLDAYLLLLEDLNPMLVREHSIDSTLKVATFMFCRLNSKLPRSKNNFSPTLAILHNS